MVGLTRGPVTLVAAGCAGLLVWVATQINDTSTGGYWGAYGVLVGAGLLVALAQLAGGWTKWGRPRISRSVFLIAFVPSLMCVLWLALAGQPNSNWFEDHVVAWSSDIGIGGLVEDLLGYLAVFAFGLGLVLGFTAETAPPAPPAEPAVRRVEDKEPVGEPAHNGSATRSRERVPSH